MILSRKSASALCIPFLFPVGLLADTVRLRGGDSVEGELIGQSLKAITIRTARGPQTIEKSRIQKIEYGETGEERQRIRDLQARQKRIAERQDQANRALAERLRAEQTAQEAVLQKRKALVSSISEELARLAEHEKDLDRQQRKIEQERSTVETQKRNAQFRQKAMAGELRQAVFVRSLVAPGYGQIYASRTGPGILWTGAFLASAYAAAQANRSLALARSDYRGHSAERFSLPTLAGATFRGPTAIWVLQENARLYARFSSAQRTYAATGTLVIVIYALQAYHAWKVGAQWQSDLKQDAAMDRPSYGIPSGGLERPREHLHVFSQSFAF